MIFFKWDPSLNDTHEVIDNALGYGKTSDRSYKTSSSFPFIAKAALLLTEAINFSINTSKLYCLYLDAKSAFNRALREILRRRMYLDGTAGHSLLYLYERLANRVTFIEWEKTIKGRIHDQQGIEQGGPNSSEEYKLKTPCLLSHDNPQPNYPVLL